MNNYVVEGEKEVIVTIPAEAGRIERFILKLALDNNAKFAENLGELTEGDKAKGYCVKATFSKESQLNAFCKAAEEQIEAKAARA